MGRRKRLGVTEEMHGIKLMSIKKHGFPVTAAANEMNINKRNDSSTKIAKS